MAEPGPTQPGSAPSAPVLAAPAFVAALRERGFDFCAGVPCSLIKGVLAHLTDLDAQGVLPYVPAAREDSALGIAAGAYLGGKLPVVLMQGSGLALSLNALVSLHQLYGLEVLLLITWRGYQGRDAPEHVVLGPLLPQVLETFGVPHRTLLPAAEGGTPARVAAELDWARETLSATRKPCALLVRQGAL